MRLIKRILRFLPVPLSLEFLNMIGLFLSRSNNRALRIWWYNKFYRGGVIKYKGHVFYLHQNDVVSRQVFASGYFDNHVFKTLLEFSQLCQSFVDVGANIGVISINLAKHVDISGLALEPASSNFKLLQDNVRANHVLIQTMQVAAGAEDGTATMFLSDTNRGDHRLGSVENEERMSETVIVKRLDNCVDEANLLAPFLVKIDVQGFESHVLQGATSLLGKPCYIVMEVWPNGLKICGSSVESLDQLCKSENLQIYCIGENGELKFSESLITLTDDLPDTYGAHIDVLLTNQPIHH